MLTFKQELVTEVGETWLKQKAFKVRWKDFTVKSTAGSKNVNNVLYKNIYHIV